jgi:NADH-quinone oxidoreductase subunit C
MFISFLFKSIFYEFIISLLLRKEYLILLLKNISYSILFFILKNSSFFKFQTLSDLTAINYPEHIFEFELNCIILSYQLNIRIWIKFFFKKDALMMSLSGLYTNSNWFEREIWDFYGIKIICHCDLRRILTDYGFIGHPMLKLFPLIGFIELRFDDILSKIIKEPIELMQNYRFFFFLNPWNLWYY